MSPFAFLLIPVVIVVAASLILWLRGRQPTTLSSGIDSFQREMHALSPDAAVTRAPRRFESDGQLESSTRRQPSLPRRPPTAPDPHAPPVAPPPRRPDPEA